MEKIQNYYLQVSSLATFEVRNLVGRYFNVRLALPYFHQSLSDRIEVIFLQAETRISDWYIRGTNASILRPESRLNFLVNQAFKFKLNFNRIGKRGNRWNSSNEKTKTKKAQTLMSLRFAVISRS